MKREIIPGRFILLILAAFLAIMVLPIVLASLSGQLDLPVEQSYASDTQELTIAPKADWSIVSVLPQEDGLLAPEMTGEGVTVPRKYSDYRVTVDTDLPAGVTCQRLT